MKVASYSYTCPLDIQNYEIIRDKSHLNDLLLAKGKKGDWRTFYNKTKQFLYCNCTQCKARLRFKKMENQRYKLIFFKNEHEHRLENRRTNRNLLEKFIEQFPQSASRKSVLSLAALKFPSLSSYAIASCYGKLKRASISYQETIKEMGQKGYEISQLSSLKTSPQPSYILIVSPEMKKMFSLYGRFCSFDITYRVFKQEQSQLRLGVFTGLSSRRKLIPYAYTILNSEKTHVLKTMFKEFFRIMNNKRMVIVTDQQRSIRSALQQLRQEKQFDGSHYLDVFHILRLISKKAQNVNLVRFCSRLFLAPSKNEFEKIKQELQTFKAEEVDIVEEFLDNKEKFCIAFTEPVFLGISITSSHSQSINKLIKDCFKTQKKIQLGLIVLNRLFNRMISSQPQHCTKEKVDVENFYKLPELKQIREKLHKQNFEIIWKNIADSLQLTYNRQTRNSFVVNQNQMKEQVTYYFDEEKYYCSCQFQQKSGLPCKHLILILVKEKLKIMPYIESYWIVND